MTLYKNDFICTLVRRLQILATYQLQTDGMPMHRRSRDDGHVLTI